MLTRLLRRLTPIVLLLTIGLLISSPDSRPNLTVAAQELDFEEELAKGRDLYRRGRYEDALKSFKRANEMREKKCAECYSWMAETYRLLEAHKNVIESADKAIEFANGDRQLVLKAYNNKGLALQSSAERKDQKKLQASEAVFKEALGVEGARPIIHYNLGITLLQLKRDEEGVAAIKEYIKLEPRGPYIEMARKLVENPRRARENFAPDFAFTSSEGEHLALEDLRVRLCCWIFGERGARRALSQYPSSAACTSATRKRALLLC